MLVTDLPAEAYGEVANAFKANPGGTGGIKPESIETAAGLAYYTVESAKDGAANVRRYSMILPGPTFSGYVAVQVPENASRIYTDDAVRQMFATAVIRNEVPVEEQLGLMPFKISELSSFKNVRTLAPGAALILSDGDEKTGFEVAPFMIIGLIGSTAASPDDRGRFAQQIATTIPGVRDGRITMSEPVRIDGQPGYETRIDATSGKDNTPVTIVQWLRFGAADLDAHHRLFAARRLDQGLSALPRRARRNSSAQLTRKFAKPAETSGFRSYTNGTSFSPSGSQPGRSTMFTRRLVLTGLAATSVAALVPSALWAAPIKPDDASALLVIDVQNCFLPGGSLAVKDGEQVVPIINRIAKGFANVVMTQDWHTAGHVSFATSHSGKKPFETVDLSYGKQVLWPDHCVQGTEGASLSKDLAIPHAGLVIRKGFNKDVDSYSAFTEADGKTTTGLAAYLKARKVKRVFLAGLATDFCVAWSALDARKAGFETYVIEDACRGIDTQGSLAKAWADMAKAGVKRIQSGDIAA